MGWGKREERGVGWGKRETHTSRRRATRTSVKEERFRNRNTDRRETEKEGSRQRKGWGVGGTHQQEEEEEGHQDESSEGHGHWHRRSLLRFPEHVLHRQRTITLNKPVHTEEHTQTTMSVWSPYQLKQTRLTLRGW